ncbi:hypothetical protein [Cecembia lonarensis]|uniref:UDP-N-acetylglucosamine kinase n=1 Tax=Cecembia lonarensis (strain CCUG 58316 / KCTC 22772 / LW9) TaxID=1225176 RepID=K1L987_CECL9|nr:hypothetical protein [Cecembia lonarensis]EKB51206.1 hypothetical protein B879_00257 [Cecembia lonarensis LW9]
MKKLYIIAGCNGAGKTTASYTILPEILDCKEFVNADEIAKGISPFQPEKAGIEAGRYMLKVSTRPSACFFEVKVELALSKNQSYGQETGNVETVGRV